MRGTRERPERRPYESLEGFEERHRQTEANRPAPNRSAPRLLKGQSRRFGSRLGGGPVSRYGGRRWR